MTGIMPSATEGTRVKGSVAAVRRPFGEEEGPGPLRRGLLALWLLGAVGLTAELLLLEHFESVWQWIPLVVLGAGIASGAAVAVRPAPVVLRGFRVVMVLTTAAGLIGLYLHLEGNIEFELEMDPALRGAQLFWSALRGATPALAPGAMMQLGLLGLVYAYRHPALRRGGMAASGEDAE
jgi:hypothetical protein